MAAAVQRARARRSEPPPTVIEGIPTEQFIPGLEKLTSEDSTLTSLQEREKQKFIKDMINIFDEQEDDQNNRDVLRLRKQYVHMHGTIGGDKEEERKREERAVASVIAMKVLEMSKHGMEVIILNLNFLKRLQTLALYKFIKDHLLHPGHKSFVKVRFRIQEEDPDKVDHDQMMDLLRDVAEDCPLFVVTDETCKEPERIDDFIALLTKADNRFHFWSSSTYAHGTPTSAERRRLAMVQECPESIKMVTQMIDIDDDDFNITGPHRIPLRRVVYPLLDYDNIREHLAELPVRLISHNKKHLKADVWDCEPCGAVLAEYLKDFIGLGKPGLKNKEVFIVGSIDRFETKIEIRGMQVSLLDKDILSEVLFCRRAVRIQDILKTMDKVVVSDSISMRGVDKKIVIIIPSPRRKKEQSRIERELREEKKTIASGERYTTPKFEEPIPYDPEDEVVMYRREAQEDDIPEDYDKYRKKKTEESSKEEDQSVKKEKPRKAYDAEVERLFEDVSDDDDTFPPPKPPNKRSGRKRYTFGNQPSVLRRAVNSLGREDKDMILDIFTDAPRHAVVFHFAEDEHQAEDKQKLEEQFEGFVL